MTSSALSYFPFYPADWATSRTRLMLDPDQRSAYFDLICLMYQSSGGIIPVDLDFWERYTGVTKDRLTVVQRSFNECSGGVTHPRVQRELERMKKLRDQQSEAGKRSAKSRVRNKKERPFNDRSTTVQPTEQNRTEQNRREISTPLTVGTSKKCFDSSSCGHEIEVPNTVARDPKIKGEKPAKSAGSEVPPPPQPWDFLPGDKADREAPWNPKRFMSLLGGRDGAALKDRFFEATGRGPHDPAPGWSKRDDVWTFNAGSAEGER